MVHIAIIEDEAFYCNQIKELLERYQTETETRIKISAFSDGEDILDNYTGDYDIILMDIQMLFLDGMATAREIRKLDSAVIIIFVTNMTQYAIQGYEVNAFYYLVKPIEYFSLSRILDKAIEKISEKKHHFVIVSTEDGIVRLDVSSIYSIESQGHTLVYWTKSGRYEVRGVMKQVEASMEPYGFFCCNKGVLVNLEYVDSIKEDVCVVCDETFPVSRRRRKLFLESLLKFANETR